MTTPPPPSATEAAPATSALVAAARGRHTGTPPVWFMRQAGRSLPEYHAVRRDIPMLEACRTPDLVAEITLQPVRRHHVDAAILYSDIVVPLVAIGLGVDIVAGVGPVVEHPIRAAADLAAVRDLEAGDVEFVRDAVRLLVAELGPTPLIGFAGAPFTLASYLVEGGPSKDHARTKALMHSEPALWHDLLGRLAQVSSAFLQVQVDAGVSAVQLFDSWAGALSEADYREFVLPHSATVFSTLVGDIPRIHFGVGTAELLPAMREAGADVSGVDWRTPLDVAATRLRAAATGTPLAGKPVTVQGNLDPALLFAGWPVIETAVRRIVAEGNAADGHIFNLGHGVLPGTDPTVLTRVVELIHSL